MNRKIEFIPAICPKCGGRLELDSSFERAVCKDCKGEVIIKNAKRRRKDRFDKVVSFIEREQGIVGGYLEKRREEKLKEKEAEKEEEKIDEERLKEDGERISRFFSKNFWKLILLIVGFMLLCTLLEKI